MKKWSIDGRMFHYESLDELICDYCLPIGKTIYCGNSQKSVRYAITEEDVLRARK